MILSRSFILSNSIILVKDLIRWKRRFEIFLIDHDAGDAGNKNIVGKVLVIHCVLGMSVKTGSYIYNSLILIIYVSFICM